MCVLLAGRACQACDRNTEAGSKVVTGGGFGALRCDDGTVRRMIWRISEMCVNVRGVKNCKSQGN